MIGVHDEMPGFELCVKVLDGCINRQQLAIVCAVVWARATQFVLSNVTRSVRHLLRRSTSNAKCSSMSAPMMGYDTSATINDHLKARRNPRSMVTCCPPYVLIGVPLAAYNL